MSKAQESLVAKRYANALLDLAEDANKVDVLLKDIESLEATIQGSDSLQSLLKNPLVDNQARTDAVLKVAKKAKLNKLTENFIGVLGRNKRLSILSTVLEVLRAEISARRGEVKADVVSATALSKTQIKNLQSSLKKVVGTDVEVNLTVDEALIGGLIVKLGSLQIDYSLKTRLDRLERALKSSNIAEEVEPMREVA